jgi:hypothetical protein
VTSLILLVIVAAWAVVLLPMLLNRHEAANEARSVDRFATAMRVLSRRTATSGDRRYVVVPPRPQSAPQVVANGARAHAPAYAEEPSPQRLARATRAVVGNGAVARRRRILLALTVLAVVAGVAAVAVSRLLWLAQVGFDLLIVMYLWRVRRVVTAARNRRVRTTAAVSVRPAASGYARAVPAPQFAVPVPDNAVVIERQQDGSWKPVPVPLPTYVTAPVARPAAAPVPVAAAAAGATTKSVAEDRAVNGRAVNE